MMAAPHQQGPKTFFFVDGAKYEPDQSTLTGAQIKALVAGLDPSFSLFLEGHGNEEDRLIGESMSSVIKLACDPKVVRPTGCPPSKNTS